MRRLLDDPTFRLQILVVAVAVAGWSLFFVGALIALWSELALGLTVAAIGVGVAVHGPLCLTTTARFPGASFWRSRERS